MYACLVALESLARVLATTAVALLRPAKHYKWGRISTAKVALPISMTWESIATCIKLRAWMIYAIFTRTRWRVLQTMIVAKELICSIHWIPILNVRDNIHRILTFSLLSDKR